MTQALPSEMIVALILVMASCRLEALSWVVIRRLLAAWIGASGEEMLARAFRTQFRVVADPDESAPRTIQSQKKMNLKLMMFARRGNCSVALLASVWARKPHQALLPAYALVVSPTIAPNHRVGV